ncbi:MULTISPECIES: HD domain-containing protein [unclassified Methanoregula]|uniref:HD domain-containing protein n=1 Tax=unclassified Methanoregula TaxID=2649730 RepID=UPI00342F5D23
MAQNQKNTIEIMRRYVEETMDRPGSHGIDHVLRVVHLCEMIGKEEHADLDVLIPAALFHDIARSVEEKEGIPHEIAGADHAERYLRSIGYDEDRIPAISHAIRSHRFSTGCEPETPEAKILSDADKLDAMGAVGIARTFIRAGEHRGEIRDGVDHIHTKLLHLGGLMYTGTAGKIACDRHAFLSLFLETLDREAALPESRRREP